MNNKRRTQISILAAQIFAAAQNEDITHIAVFYDMLENIKSDEEEYFYNIPENLQNGSRATESEEVIALMEDILDVLSEVMSEDDDEVKICLMEEAVEMLEEIV